MGKLSKKIFAFHLLGLLCITACGKPAEVGTVPTNQAGENSPLPTDISDQNLTPTPLTKPIARRILTPRPKPSPTPMPTPTPTLTPTPSPTPTPTPPLNPLLSYLEIPVNKEDIMVYISKDPMQPEVLVGKAGGKFHSFSWDYNLDYGTPNIYTENTPEFLEKYGFSDEEELLAIWLPTKPVTEEFYHYIPEDIKEICGVGHYLSLAALSDPAAESLQDIFVDDLVYADYWGDLTARNVKNSEGNEIFSVFSEDGDMLKEYPILSLPKQKDYEIIYDDLHIISNGKICQRFGIRLREDLILWLGRYRDQEISLFSYADLGFNVNYRPYLQLWWPCEIGEEGSEIFVDLDGDGKEEQLFWYFKTHDKYFDTMLSINGTEYMMISYQPKASPLLVASLDGKTKQLFIADYGEGRTEDFFVFSYRDGTIYEAGNFHFMNYDMKEVDGEHIYESSLRCYPLQNDTVTIEQKFVDGKLQIIPQDYYEFTTMVWDLEKNSFERPILSVKQEIDLYKEKGGKDTFSLPEGSHIITLGGDFSGWIQVENCDSKERGWLRFPMRSSENEEENQEQNLSGTTCILPDGRKVEGRDIFEGLMIYD